MAKETMVVLRCDWHDDGTVADRTVPFRDGDLRFELDLCRECRLSLRSGARRIKPRATKVHSNDNKNGNRRKPRPRDPQPSVVREWAQSKGIAVSDHGRVPAEVVKQYKESVAA